MAKDTAEAPGTAEQLAWDQATQDYRKLVAEYELLPKNEMGSAGNEYDRAVKLAKNAKNAAMSDYFKAVQGTTEDPFRYNPRNNPETAYFTDAEGNFGLGIRPENLYYNDYSGTMVEGIPQSGGAPAVGPGDLTLGGPSEGSEYVAGQDPFAPPPNYQQSGGTGLPNGGIPEGYLPDSSGNSYWDFISNGGTVPNYPRPSGSPAQTPPPYTGNRPPLVNENFGQAGGGVTGVAKAPQIDTSDNWLERLGGPLQGFDSSSNKDFYQKQFQEMRATQSAQKVNDLAAALRREAASKNPPASAMDDPWSWANLPEVQMGTGQRNSATQIAMNPQFDWGQDTTNQQILADIFPRLSDTEQVFLRKNPLNDAPSFLDQSAFFDYTSNKNPNDKAFSNALNKIYNNVWTTSSTGAAGPTTPVGYASPINA